MDPAELRDELFQPVKTVIIHNDMVEVSIVAVHVSTAIGFARCIARSETGDFVGETFDGGGAAFHVGTLERAV